MDNEDALENIHTKFFRTKGKCEGFLKQKDIYVDVKEKQRPGKCLGADSTATTTMSQSMVKRSNEDSDPTTNYNIISNDIWYHVSDYIAPEDVQSFATICRQTADFVNSKRFWKNLFVRYCQKSSKGQWIIELPEYLQYDNIISCDLKTMRCRVIEALFYCYEPFKERINRGYTLDFLLGRTLITTWHQQHQCAWLMYYKFRDKLLQQALMKSSRSRNLSSSNVDEVVVNDWETLADDNEDEDGGSGRILASSVATNPNEGTSLLIIGSDRFVPFPENFFYGSDEEARMSLVNVRRLLTKDIRGTKLELDFEHPTTKAKTTIQYPHMLLYKVVPWWHPIFNKLSR